METGHGEAATAVEYPLQEICLLPSLTDYSEVDPRVLSVETSRIIYTRWIKSGIGVIQNTTQPSANSFKVQSLK